MTEQSETKPNMEQLREINNITILRPGGNDTALVQGIDYSPEERKAINDAIMESYTNVEQVGFYDTTDPKKPTLIMAGGEFCGNATRSVALLALKGKEGEVNISVSGVDKPLRAGVDQRGNAWAEMPIRPNTSCSITDNSLKVVELEGITQVIAGSPKGSTVEEIKAEGMEILSKLGLTDSVEASGVMFISKDGNGIKTEPVVWVRDIERVFYETACGSGTAAMGIAIVT